jgi:hypothetical protein
MTNHFRHPQETQLQHYFTTILILQDFQPPKI